MLRDDRLTPHHIAYAVQDHDKSEAAFFALGYVPATARCHDEGRNLFISFLENSGTRIEILSVADKTLPSPIDSQLKGGGKAAVYHICYETADLDAAVAKLRKEGFLLLVPPEPAPAIEGRAVVFLYHKHMGVIELLAAQQT